MRSNASRTVLRQNYRAPSFLIERVEIGFDLDPNLTRVATRIHLRRQSPGTLELDGEDLRLVSIAVDGKTLAKRHYRVHALGLSIKTLPERCVLDLGVEISPAANSLLMGLYVSSGNLFTQCEAEGFRRITYFLDRPDVMTCYSVMLRADRTRFPVLLCNGNQVGAGELEDGRHYALWHDPFPKPSYLFALVAGRLAHRERRIELADGRLADLQIFVEEKDLDQVEHAMNSLHHAVRWDEQRFGLELDLERFMIVAVDDFNLGAMENKGLNIFNTKYLLASPETCTDADLVRIESLVGHEYFHNWTGNRVTCRDWFQLTLKEGLTVFRDQEFSADRAAGFLGEEKSPAEQAAARAVHRIEVVRTLRSAQFPEDAGPMAHPIRPESYEEINNFYSTTVYEKGAEVVRMMQTLIGREAFGLGITEYFRRFDGQAVTCEDFVDAMQSAAEQSGLATDLTQFRRWYQQAGTPRLKLQGSHDAATKTFRLDVMQHTPRVGIERSSTATKPPLHIPLRIGLLDENGQDIPLRMSDHAADAAPSSLVLSVTKAHQSFSFEGIKSKPVPSLLRDFSAPVIIDYPYADQELAHLAGHDSDPFNRWEALQRLAVRAISSRARSEPNESIERHLLGAVSATLSNASLDANLRALAVTLPGEYVVGEELPVFDPQAVHAARIHVTTYLASKALALWRASYANNTSSLPYVFGAQPVARRALAAVALDYIAAAEPAEADALAWRLFEGADNMTSRYTALQTLVWHHLPHAQAALERFYARHHKHPAVIDKWLRVQALASAADQSALARVRELLLHPCFNYRNPNKVQALLGGFFSSNPSSFHLEAVYPFWVEQVITVDQINPSSASRLARAMDRWLRLPARLQPAAHRALESLASHAALSRDVSEIVDKALRA